MDENRAMGAGGFRPPNEQQMQLQELMRSLNQMNRPPDVMMGTGNELGYANLMGRGMRPQSRPMIAGSMGTQTPMGLLEMSREFTPAGPVDEATLRNQMPMMGGLLGADVFQSMQDPSRGASMSYQRPVGPGMASVRQTNRIGQDEQLRRDQQMQYLMQVGKNMGLGLYADRADMGAGMGPMNYGVRMQGQF